DSEIHILSVVTQVGPASHPGVALSIEKELAENIREELKPIVQELTDAGYNAKAEVIVDQRQRNAGHKVVEYAEEEEVDLIRSEEHTSELQSRFDLVCRLLLEKKTNDLDRT